MNEELLSELQSALNELMQQKPKTDFEFRAINELIHSFVDVIYFYERSKSDGANE